MIATRVLVFGLAGLAAITLFDAVGVAQTVPRPLVTSRVVEENRTTLPGNTRPEATPLNSRGRLNDATRFDHMFLLLQRAPEREQALVSMIDQLHDRTSPNFHHWLSPQQIGEH
jgi:hypothetical protein